MINKNPLFTLEGHCRRGWKLFPCRAKNAPLVKWKEAATSDPKQIRKWWAQFPDCLWAAVTGSASGIVVLDLDRGHDNGADGVETLKKYMRERGLSMPATLHQRTPSGGWHYFFKMPEGADIRNAAGILSGVDVRGSGGYVVVCPSLNYECQDQDAPTEGAPDWFLELVSRKDRNSSIPDAKAPHMGAQAAYCGHGGSTVYGMKALRDEIATLRAAEQGTRNDTLNRCAVKLYALAAGGQLDADAVTRELETAATTIGLTYQEITATLASARRAGYASPRKAPEQATASSPQVSPAAAIPEEPMPLRRPPQEQAEYPVNAFLGFAQTVEDVATLTNTPSSMVGGTLLAVLSLLAQRHVNVKTLKFVTPLIVFVLIVGETGDGKSLVERILTKPARDKEKMLLQAYEDDLKDYLIEMKAYERELKRLDAKKNLSREAYAAELAELEKTRPSVPVKPVFIIGDFNYEGLFRNLKEGLPYIGIFTDEGGRLFGGTAFSQENMMKTIANLTTVWSGGAWDKMRAGEGVSKLYDRRICASVMVQPQIAERIFSDKLMSGQGYLCRQLVSWPVPMMKSPEQAEIESMPSVQFFYRQCEALLDLPVRTDEGNGIIFDDLELSPDALDAYKAFFTYIEERRTEGGMYEAVNGYAKRAAEQALRIAGCLSMGLNPACRVITLEVMEAGIKLAEWYLDEILRITLDDMASPEVLAAEKLLKWLHGRRLEKTSIRQILQYGPGALREKKAVVPVIDMLAEHGWLVPLPEGGMVIMGSKESYARQAWKVVYAVPDKD